VLTELRLENYAVVDNLAVEFGAGLNLLTGETGTGKSILIDALALLLGEKASADVIRAGAERTVVLAVFEVEDSSEKMVRQLLENNGIDSDEALILRREIASGGRGRVFVNNQPATVGVLRQLAPHLANIHAQNESLLSFDAAARLSLLDGFARVDTEAVAGTFATWKNVKTRIEELERDEQDRLRLLDLWAFQKREIEQAKLQRGEDERLEAEKHVLANAEKIYSAAMSAFDLLYDGTTSSSASLRAAQKYIEDLARYEPKFQEAVAALDSARISVEDVGSSLRDYAGGIEASPEHLAEIEDRLAAIDRLKRKYGSTLEEVMKYGEEVSRKVAEMENKDEVLRELHGKLTEAAQQYLQAAQNASKRRYEAARKLEKLVEAEINELAMKVSFRIEVSGAEDAGNWRASGLDQVVYMISTNPGEPRCKLEEIASGGELSRVLLALKTTVESGCGPSPTRNAANGKGRSATAQRTIVFDEIDTGIGGRAAEAVGKKLKALSRTNQVLCVTHLPQIATFADYHYVIEKRQSAGRARTVVRLITGGERTDEVARMLSGARLTETSRKHADQMLKANA